MTELYGKSIVCACVEGQERSIYANDFLAENNIMSRVLPGGLEELTKYLFDDEIIDKKIERLSARGVDRLAEYRIDHNAAFTKLLNLRNSIWLVFVGEHEEQFFSDTIEKLRESYGIEVKVLNSHDKTEVEENIKNVLLGEI